MDAGPLEPGKHDVGGWVRISLEGAVRSRNLGQNSCCAAPARGALLALGLLLVTPAPGWGQDADRTIPCVDGMAGGYACDRVDLLGRLSREELGAADTVKLNDVWGWTDPQNGREYALVGRMDGTAFVDVTDPYDPRYLGSLAGTAGSRIKHLARHEGVQGPRFHRCRRHGGARDAGVRPYAASGRDRPA